MTRSRVLCVSGDRSTRATVTLALTDAPVDVVVAQSDSEAVDHVERGVVDAAVLDATTVANVPGLIGALENRSPGTPAFVHWGEDDASSVSALAEVIDRNAIDRRTDRLADVVTDRLESESNADLNRLVGRVKRRLADATTPGAVERAVREEFTGHDRFAFAWIGEYDPGEGEIVPWLTGAENNAWPIHRTFAVGDGSQPLLERAMGRREIQVVQQVAGNRPIVPLADAAVDREASSLAVAPLCSDDEVYGVVVAYAVDPFSEAEREIVRDLSETASHAVESVAVRGRLTQRERTLTRYERLVETAGDGMCVLDDEGHVTTVNDALLEMTGYSREGLLGEHVSVLFGEEDARRGIDTMRTAFENGESTDTIEASLATKDGTEIPCETQVAVLSHDGAFDGAVGVVRDVTERKRRVTELREQNERLDAFARIVSHDLRNPLGVAQGYLDLAADEGSTEGLEHVRESLERMDAIIEDVLALARGGPMVDETDPVDLESIARDAWANVATESATLAVDGTVTFEADRSRLLRALENLFRNAVEHGATSSRPGADDSVEHGSTNSRDEDRPDDSVEHGSTSSRPAADDGVEHGGESVTVRVGPLDEESGFFVADDGPGIPEEIRSEAFDPDVSASSDGLGIGLWVVREVAEGHGWSTEATESVDGGARFEFAGIETSVSAGERGRPGTSPE